MLGCFVTNTRDNVAALEFIKKAMRRHGTAKSITTDGLRSYKAAVKQVGNPDLQARVEPTTEPRTHTSRSETSARMLRFQRMKTLQKLASVCGSVHNHLNQDRHLIDRERFKERRAAALAEWRAVMS